jgi:hypothetical protein
MIERPEDSPATEQDDCEHSYSGPAERAQCMMHSPPCLKCDKCGKWIRQPEYDMQWQPSDPPRWR